MLHGHGLVRARQRLVQPVHTQQPHQNNYCGSSARDDEGRGKYTDDKWRCPANDPQYCSETTDHTTESGSFSPTNDRANKPTRSDQCSGQRSAGSWHGYRTQNHATVHFERGRNSCVGAHLGKRNDRHANHIR